MSMYSCPVMPRSDIVKTLADYHIIGINESQFTNPSTTFVYDLYVALLVRLGFLKDDNTQVDFSALEHFDNLDLHSDAIRVMNLFAKIKQALAAVQSQFKFTLDDLIRPETQRTLRFVSDILNFFMHKESTISDLTEHFDAINALEDQRREYEATISQVNAEISACADFREKDTPLVQELEARVKDLGLTIHNLNNEQLTLRTTLRKLKEKAKEMEEKISKAEFELLQSAQENASLQGKLVQSPDKLQKALEEKKALLDQAKNFVRSAVKEFQDKSAAYDLHLKVSKKMSKQSAQMQALQEQVIAAKSIEKNVKQLKSKLADDQLQERSLQAKIVELQGTDQELSTNKKEAEKERNLKCEAYRSKLKKVQLEMESMRQDLKIKEKEIKAVRAQADSITLKINACKKRGKETQQALVAKGEMIVDELNKYWSAIEEPLANIEALDITES